MKNIGLSGGIGSGKSTVSKILTNNGIPVYDSDSRAKLLMNSSVELKDMIINHFGIDSYINNKLNINITPIPTELFDFLFISFMV